MPRHPATAAIVLALLAAAMPVAARDGTGRPPLVLAAGQTTPATPLSDLSPEERMQRRYPQPVRVGDLIGLPVLDDRDRTLGYVQSVVRTPAGKIRLIVLYGGFLGWGRRLVAVPVEVVAIAGRQLAALDMTRAEFDTASAWSDPESRALPASDIIRVGLYRR
jgi:PRC-barrel domain